MVLLALALALASIVAVNSSNLGRLEYMTDKQVENWEYQVESLRLPRKEKVLLMV